MTKQLVVDASVIVKCLFPENDTSYALELFSNSTYELLAPDFLLLEISNAMWKKVKNSDIKIEDAISILNDFNSNLSIKLFPFSEYINRAFNIAFSIEHNSIYDCLYSALAEKQSCPLITADLAYISKLTKAGINHQTLTLTQITTH